MQNSVRSFKVSCEIKKKITWIINYKLNDPRLCNILISILDVNVSRDFSFAKVYFSVLSNKQDISIKQLLGIFYSSSKYIQYLLAKNIYLRKVPILKFYYDNSYIHGMKITCLIHDVLLK